MSDSPPVSALPTPSTQVVRKRKSPVDIDDVSPSIETRRPTVPSFGRRNNALHGIDSVEGPCETRFRKSLETITLTQPATQPATVPIRISAVSPLDHTDGDPFSFVYEKLPLQQGRNYQAEVIEIPATSKLPAPLWELCARQGQDFRFFLRLKRAGFTQDEATLICGKFVDALNRWPDVDALSSKAEKKRGPTRIVRTLFSAIQHSVKPDKSLRFFAPRLSSDGCGGISILGVIQYIDPDTLQAKKHDFKFPPNSIDSEVSIPDRAETHSISFAKVSNLVGPIREPAEDGSDPSMIDLSDMDDENQVRRMRKAEHLARLCCAIWLRTRSPLKPLSEVKEFIKDMHRLFVSETRAFGLDGTTNGGRREIFSSRRVRILARSLRLPPQFNTFVEKGKWPVLRIASPDYSWSNPVREAGTAVWLQTNDLRGTWMAMARATDQVNARIHAGEVPPSFCTCTDEVKSAHPCGLCGVVWGCASLQLHSSSGLRACARCHVRYPSHGSAAQMLTRLQISGILSQDKKGYNKTIESAVIEDVLKTMRTWADDLLSNEQGSRYPSQYTARQLQPILQTRYPDSMSIDAVFPFVLHSSGQVLIHSAENCALIPLSLNYLKHIHLPIFLSKVSVYYHQYLALDPFTMAGQLEETRELEQIRQKLVADCNELATIRRKVPYKRKTRMELQVSPEQIEYLKEEWVSGKLRPNSPAQPLPRYTDWLSCPPVQEEWETQMPYILQIIEEIEDFTGVCLPRGSDGCPFFAHPDTMPSDWNWQICVGFMAFKTMRLTLACNAKWTTEDTPLTIFLECIFQVSVGCMVILAEDPDSKRDLRSKYAEFLGLPLVIRFCNPLTISIAHRIHGKQMRTGWPKNPTKLMDRINENNNLLIETQASNYIKCCFNETHYQRLRDQVLDVQIPLEWANDNVQPRPFDPELELGLPEKLEDGDFDDEDDVWRDMEESIEEDGEEDEV